MHRVLGVFVLAACACVVTGCGGGSSLQAKARKFLHDPAATVTRAETLRMEDGTRWTITLVKGSRPHRLGCVTPGLVQPPCPRSRYALLGFSATTHALGLYWNTSAAQVAAIAVARRTSPRLRIFPDLAPLTVRCAIPRGGPPGRTVAGYCSTDAVTNGQLIRVNLTAGWPLHPKTHGSVAEWIVMVTRHGRIQSIHANRTARQLH
jgi:hypothetical protein